MWNSTAALFLYHSLKYFFSNKNVILSISRIFRFWIHILHFIFFKIQINVCEIDSWNSLTFWDWPSPFFAKKKYNLYLLSFFFPEMCGGPRSVSRRFDCSRWSTTPRWSNYWNQWSGYDMCKPFAGNISRTIIFFRVFWGLIFFFTVEKLFYKPVKERSQNFWFHTFIVDKKVEQRKKITILKIALKFQT